MSSYPLVGVPRIIHQIWLTSDVSPDLSDTQSWIAQNPEWHYMFWDDTALNRFMGDHFPDFLDLYLSYSKPVQKADLARYCLIKHFGGIYADIDTRCLSSLEPLAEVRRIILCAEPDAHNGHAKIRGLNRLYFNGTMASPAGHPFWDSVLSYCKAMGPRRKFDVLDTTGPCLFSAAIKQWPDPEAFSLNSAHLFTGRTSNGELIDEPRTGEFGHLNLSEHMWAGTWLDESDEPEVANPPKKNKGLPTLVEVSSI